MKIYGLSKEHKVSSDHSTAMLFGLTLLVMVIHVQTIHWLKRPQTEPFELTPKPIEMVILPPPPKPILEPIQPKPTTQPPPPKVLPKPELKPPVQPAAVKPKVVAPPKASPVRAVAPVMPKAPMAKEITTAQLPIVTAPAQATTPQQVAVSSATAAGASQSKVLSHGDDSSAETYVKGSIQSSHKPAYPSSARNRHIEGSVTVLYKVNADGSVDDVSVTHSSGSEILDEAALDAAREDTFVPARRGNKAVASTYSRIISFQLTDAD